MGDQVTVSVEYDHRKIRSRLRAELIKQGQKFMHKIPAKLLLLPERERWWRYACQQYSPHKGEHLLDKKIMLAVTTLHPPIYRIVQQIELDELIKQGMRRGLGAVAWKVIHEWELQGRPKAEPVKVGRAQIMMEGGAGPICLKTERRKGKLLYMVTKEKEKKEEVSGKFNNLRNEGIR